MDWTRHLLIVPILLPLITGAVLLLIEETRHTLKALISLASTLLLVAAALASRTGPRRSPSCSCSTVWRP